MKRRSKIIRKGDRARRVKTSKPKRASTPSKAAPVPSPAASDLAELGRVTRERDEAREQQAATSEVLQVISRSQGDLQPVFAAILDNAVRLCQASFGDVYSWERDTLRLLASHNSPPAFAEDRRRSERSLPSPGSATARILATRQPVHIVDLATEPAYVKKSAPGMVAAVELGGVRTFLGVPMLKENELIGILFLSRRFVRPFTDTQIELVKNFAAQAVIAIENARLLNELRKRTKDLGEALDQQTATADVLKVISRSQFDLQLVLDNLIETATSLCGAKRGVIFRADGDLYHAAAFYNATPELIEFVKSHPIAPGRHTVTARVAFERRVIHVADLQEDADYTYALRDTEPIRTELGVPMFRADDLVGVFILYKLKVEPFTDKQIELVTTFADQAVIAIENARLLSELRQALEQQTATSEVLQVISSSPGDLEPVFSTMLEKAVRICGATFGNIYRWDGDALRIVALHNTPPKFAQTRTPSAFRHSPTSIVGVMVATKAVVHVADVAASPAYVEHRDPAVIAAVELGGVRTFLAVPMLKESELVGAFALYRQEVRPFTDEQIALVKSFAKQAVIAIDNARLLNELRQRTDDLGQRTTDLTEALEQQTATAEVLRVISSSPSDLQPVFASMLEKAVTICDAKFGNIYRWDGDTIKLVAAHNTPQAFAEYRHHSPQRADAENSIYSRMSETKTAIHVIDAAMDQRYAQKRHPVWVAGVELGGVRTFLAVPMLKEDELIGSFSVYRQEVRPFTDKQIALVTNFAAQAVIAIENARLLSELRERTDQLQTQSKELADLNQQLEHRVTEQVDEIERMSRLRRFLPPQVADLIVASGSERQLESHRREITALFCDLRGFTGFSESSDPEDVMALLRDYHAAIGEIIIKYSGTLERYAGDGVMVVFNDPVPVENPALQAVLMALEMRDAIGALTETWRRWGHDIGFGIGIAHGFATLGTIGFEGRFDYAAIGTVSNVASRLCDEAKPGQILISPRVLTKVEDAVTVEPVGEFALKGIRRPLAAYNVIAATT